jgi:hypothetical protein
MSIDDGICQFVIILPHKNNATLTRNKSLLGAPNPPAIAQISLS